MSQEIISQKKEAFARKYRPGVFESILGQKDIAQILKNSISKGGYHAYLFSGPRGVGKTSMARIVAKSFNCPNKTPGSSEPCSECEVCQRIARGEDTDVLEIDGASATGVDNIRNLKESVQYRPSNSRYKIFIIDEVHMLSNSAFNALLKILEEPPSYVKFIFATTELNKIPETILSRCQRFIFNKIQIEDVIQHLKDVAQKENINIDESTIRAIALRVDGAMRDSLVILEQLSSMVTEGTLITLDTLDKIFGNIGQYSQKIIDSILARNIVQLLKDTRSFCESGASVADLLQNLAQKFHDLLLVKVLGDKKDECIEGTSEYLAWLDKTSKQCQPDFLHSSTQQILDAQGLVQGVSRSVLFQIVLEVVLIKIARWDSLLSLKQIEQNLQALEDKIARHAPPRGGAAFRNEASTYTCKIPIPQTIDTAAIPTNAASTSLQTIDTAAIPTNAASTSLQTSSMTTSDMQTNNTTISTTPGDMLTTAVQNNDTMTQDIAPNPAQKPIQQTVTLSASGTPSAIQNNPMSPETSDQTFVELSWRKFLEKLKEKVPALGFSIDKAKYTNHGNQITIYFAKALEFCEKNGMVEKAFCMAFGENFSYHIEYEKIDLPESHIVLKARQLFNVSNNNED